MEDIKVGIIKKAVAMLTATGCKFAIIDADGIKHGDLEVIPLKKKKVFTGMQYKPLFIEQASKIVPSDTIHEFIPPAGVDFEGYRGSLCGYCSTAWGRETYSTQAKNGKILLMRWA